MLTESEALMIVSLDHVKLELRIPADILEHDQLLTDQIKNAVNFVMKSTGLDEADLPAVRQAAVSIVRAFYDGQHEVTPNAAHNTWMDPFRSYKAE